MSRSATRPDHSYTGAYDGWIPLTAGAMWRLGDTQDAYAFLLPRRRGDEGGAVRAGPRILRPQPHVQRRTRPRRPAGANMKECISGAAFADVVLNTFFGYMPSIDGKKLLADENHPAPLLGHAAKRPPRPTALHHFRRQGRPQGGCSIVPQNADGPVAPARSTLAQVITLPRIPRRGDVLIPPDGAAGLGLRCTAIVSFLTFLVLMDPAGIVPATAIAIGVVVSWRSRRAL